MQILYMILYTAITLGVLIIIHEFGHFIAAKLTGMRVDRFSVGFPPRAFGKKIGDTDYCVSWVPIGGYVKIAGMIDESMDTEFVGREPQPWEFRSKPIWARMAVISAGVFMNLLLALMIFWSLHYIQGTYTAETTDVGYVMHESAFGKAGLQSGDRITAVNGKAVTRWDELQQEIFVENLGENITLTVERQGKETSIFVPASAMPPPSDAQIPFMIAHTVTVVDGVDPSMPAHKLGITQGDTLLAINDTLINQISAVTMIRANSGKEISVRWKHGSEVRSGKAVVTSAGRIGIIVGSRYVGPSKQVRYSLVRALEEGFKDIGRSLHLIFLTFEKIFSGKASVKESLGGPVAIAQLATQSAEMGILTFIWFMAQLSVSLALLNILPIPALDGGHLAMLLYEKIFGREIPYKVKIAIQQVGFILLLAFMAFIIYNDITRF